ncbi:MAG: DUF433 domain-containing protein [Rubrobacter sp.]|nr:DUF433 domain-containing protein [Rubrobacter sp.]
MARSSVNPNVCFGKSTIRGHRIWVSLVPELLSSYVSRMEPETGRDGMILRCFLSGNRPRLR